MVQALWTGSVTFGLVNVPVRLYAATRAGGPRFHQIDRETGERVRQPRVSEESGREVDPEGVVKGYDVGGGASVLVEPEELEALEPERSRALEIDLDPLPDTAEVSERDLDLALKLVDEMTTDWDHSAWEDTWTERVHALLREKAEGRETTLGAPEAPRGEVIDFTEALERSLEARGGRADGGGGAGLASLTKDELYERASRADVPGRSRMTKAELVEALEQETAG